MKEHPRLKYGAYNPYHLHQLPSGRQWLEHASALYGTEWLMPFFPWLRCCILVGFVGLGALLSGNPLYILNLGAFHDYKNWEHLRAISFSEDD